VRCKFQDDLVIHFDYLLRSTHGLHVSRIIVVEEGFKRN